MMAGPQFGPHPSLEEAGRPARQEDMLTPGGALLVGATAFGLVWLLHGLSERARGRAARTGRLSWFITFLVLFLVVHAAFHVVPHWYREEVRQPPPPTHLVPPGQSYSPFSPSYRQP